MKYVNVFTVLSDDYENELLPTRLEYNSYKGAKKVRLWIILNVWMNDTNNVALQFTQYNLLNNKLKTTLLCQM